MVTRFFEVRYDAKNRESTLRSILDGLTKQLQVAVNFGEEYKIPSDPETISRRRVEVSGDFKPYELYGELTRAGISIMPLTKTQSDEK